MSHTNSFVFFWGPEHQNGEFSNWYPSPFVHDEIEYNCAEQFMMHKKAILFGDTEVAGLIMEQTDPKKQKFLGRQVRGFDQQQWMNVCVDVMVPGLVSKFTQDEDLLRIILETKDAILVEASPLDKIWGIGMDRKDPDATDPTKWKGLNLLGDALMRARDEIKRLGFSTTTGSR